MSTKINLVTLCTCGEEKKTKKKLKLKLQICSMLKPIRLFCVIYNQAILSTYLSKVYNA